eukprot:COSAG02_NODE_32658_length_512_cov_7.656174_1_plen_95_part_00
MDVQWFWTRERFRCDEQHDEQLLLSIVHETGYSGTDLYRDLLDLVATLESTRVGIEASVGTDIPVVLIPYRYWSNIHRIYEYKKLPNAECRIYA